MQPRAGFKDAEAISQPLAQLLACPPATGKLLDDSVECIDFATGETIFHQGSTCKGLYIILSGELLRKAKRLETWLMLGTVSSGELVELAAALGDGNHSYSLTALSAGSMLLLPLTCLNQAFGEYPPLRMQLLTELAREVSRAYSMCGSVRLASPGRQGGRTPMHRQ